MTKHLKRRKYEEDHGSMSDSCVYSTRSKDPWTLGFPPGVTVDELKHYCRKKIADHPKDNLHLLEGSFKDLLSEYQRSFKNFRLLGGSVDDVNKENLPQYEYRGKRKVPESLIRFEGPLDLNSEYKVSYVNYSNLIKIKRENTMENGEKILNSETPSDFRSQLENHRHASHWRFLRKNTNLHLEGEHLLQTEKAEKFIPFPLVPRPELAKRSTTLKLEGEMEKKTETRDKFSPIQLQERPPLYKKETNLHLEGDLLLLTETKEKYVPTPLQSRPKLTKKNTNLKLDGDLELMPEYKQFFVEHKCKPSQKILPVNNLKTEGDHDLKTEHSSKFTEHQLIHPTIPHLRESDHGKKFHLGDDNTVRKPEYTVKYVLYDKPERRTASKPKSNLIQEGEIDTKTENKVQFVEKTIPKRERLVSTGNISLEGDIEMNPEYKNSYVDFYASSAKSLPLPERRKPPQSHLNINIKMENGINLKPEYMSSYVDFPRQRPSVKKPEPHLSPEGNLFLQTEKREKYVPYSNVPRVVPIRRKTELSLEGPFECQPEYRKAYQAYLIRENMERKTRPFDNLSNLQAAEKVPSARKNENLQVPLPSSDKDKQDIVTSLNPEAQLPDSKASDKTKPVIKPNPTNTKKQPGRTVTTKKSTGLKLKSSHQQTDDRTATRRQGTPRKFDKFIEVPDLAYKDPYYSPISSLIHTPATTTPRCLSPVNLPPRGRGNSSSKTIFPRRPVSRSVSPRRPKSQTSSSPKRFSPQVASSPRIVSSRVASPRSLTPRRPSLKSVSPRCLSPRRDIVPSNIVSPMCLSPRVASPKSLTPRGTSPRRLSLKSVSPGCLSPQNVTSRDVAISRSGSPRFLSPNTADSPKSRFVSASRCSSPWVTSRRNSYECFHPQPDLTNERFIKGDYSSKDLNGGRRDEKSFIVIKDDLNNNDVNGLYDSNKNHEINSYDEENIPTSWDSAST